jgi:transcriptional regulator with XRE-family HTH domain
MINSTDFIKRLKKVIDYYGESASSFAVKIGVPRSSISHILSGRNKPSLEFILKILASYPEVELYWLLNGKGQFPNLPNQPIQKNPVEEKKEETPKTLFSNPEQKIPAPLISKMESSFSSAEKKIERIVIFYKDGKEIGRYVEFARETLEKDMLAIVSGKSYKHSY